MPIGQGVARFAQDISAGRWQPFEVGNFSARQSQAVGHQRTAITVIRALAGLQVEQLARDIGRVNPAGILILDLVQTAFSAAIAQSLPLSAIKRFERGLPEWHVGYHRTHFASSVATRSGPLSLAVGKIASGLPSGAIK